jgi:hypothetical protein
MDRLLPALGALLNKYRIDLTAAEVLGSLTPHLRPSPPRPPARDRHKLLSAHAAPRTAAAIDTWPADDERQTRGRVCVAAIHQSSLRVSQHQKPAAILGVNRTRVSPRIARKALRAFNL